MTWFEFWKRYDGFMREKAFLYSLHTNPYLEDPRTFDKIYDETYSAIGIKKPPTTTRASFIFKAKKFGLKVPDTLKKQK